MMGQLESLGFQGLHAPGLEVRPVPPDLRQRRIAALSQRDVVIVTSPTAARLVAASNSLPQASAVRWLAPGAGTASILRRAGIPCSHPPAGGTSEALLEMAELSRPERLRIAIVGAPGGRRLLEHELVRRGAEVDYCYLYQRELLPPAPELINELQKPEPPTVLLSSARTLEALLSGMDNAQRGQLRRARFVVSSARLAGLCRAEGMTRVTQAEGADDASMLAALTGPGERDGG